MTWRSRDDAPPRPVNLLRYATQTVTGGDRIVALESGCEGSLILFVPTFFAFEKRLGTGALLEDGTWEERRFDKGWAAGERERASQPGAGRVRLLPVARGHDVLRLVKSGVDPRGS